MTGLGVVHPRFELQYVSEKHEDLQGYGRLSVRRTLVIVLLLATPFRDRSYHSNLYLEFQGTAKAMTLNIAEAKGRTSRQQKEVRSAQTSIH